MEIKNTAKQILDKFKIKFDQQNKIFLEMNETFLAPILKDVSSIKEALSSGKIKTQIATEKWIRINDHLMLLKDQINLLDASLQIALENRSLHEWKQDSPALLDESLNKISLPYDLSIFNKESEDNFYSRFLKTWSRRYCLFINTIEKIVHKKKRYMESGRIVKINLFLQDELLISTGQILMTAWQQQLQFTATQIRTLHETVEKFKNTLLAVEELEKKDFYEQRIINTDITQALNKYESTLNEIIESGRIFAKRHVQNYADLPQNILNDTQNHWLIAGSNLYPNFKFSKRKVNGGWRRLIHKVKVSEKLWRAHFLGCQNDLIKVLEISSLQLSIARIWYETRQIVKNKFYSDIIPNFHAIQGKVRATLSVINKIFDESNKLSEFKNKLLLENRKLIRSLRDEELPTLLNLLNPELFSQTFEGFLKRLGSDIDTLSDEHTILTYSDEKNIPPKSKSDRVAVKELIREEIIPDADKKIDHIIDILQQELDAASRELARLDQILEYNLEGGLTIIKEKDESDLKKEVIEITTGGLTRVEQNIKEQADGLRLQIDQSIKAFDLVSADLQEDLQALGDNEKVLALKIRLTRAKTQASFTAARQRAWKLILSFIPTALKYMQSGVQRISDKYSHVRKLAGLSVSDRDTELSLTQYLAGVEKKIAAMPYIYQRLFRTEPLKDDRFFVGRTKVLEDFQEDFDDFKNGFEPITALIGEKGSGKTTIINLTMQDVFKGMPCTLIDLSDPISDKKVFLDYLIAAAKFPQVNSIPELIEHIETWNDQRIIIIENLHNLFLRTIEGFGAIEDLFFLISKTRNRVFWIVTCGIYAWQYLDTVFQSASFFKRILILSQLSTTEIKQMILDRHQISGYGINFTQTEKIEQNRQFRKLTGETQKKQFLQDHFFKILSEAAEGNIRVAIYLWLSAIDSFSDSDIDVPVEVNFDLQILNNLASDELFSLAGFIQHEYLIPERHARIFNQTLEDSSILIEKLLKKGLLIKTVGKFSVHPFLYRAVVKSLKFKNIL